MFEPFGLLNFIQNALQSSATQPQNPTTPQPSPAANKETPQPPQVENSTPSQPQVYPQHPDENTKSNPFLSFCDEHERRAKRIKRDK
jgi:hypothetical protein